MPELNIGTILLCVAALVIGAVVSGLIMYKLGIEHRKKVAEAQIGSAEQEASRIIDEAKKARGILKERKADRGQG